VPRRLGLAGAPAPTERCCCWPQTIEAAGYPIDHTYTDVRIVLGLLA
jgi:hypothetical protein